MADFAGIGEPPSTSHAGGTEADRSPGPAFVGGGIGFKLESEGREDIEALRSKNR